MADLQSIAAVATGLKPAVDLAESILKLIGSGKGRDDALKLYGHVVAAYQSAIAAQAAQETLIKEKRELEQQLVSFQDWEAEKERYELRAIDGDSFVYMPKVGTDNGEPAHWLCANCFVKKQKSFLQKAGKNSSQASSVFWVCGACKGILTTHDTNSPSNMGSD